MTIIDREIREQLYDPEKPHRSSWLDFVKSHKHMRTPKGLLNLRAISKLWKEQKPKRYDPRVIGFGKQQKWEKELRESARAKRDTQGQTKLTGGASTSRRLSEFGFDPAPKRCEPGICAALEKKGIDCDTVDISEYIDSTLSCEQNKKNILREFGARKTEKHSQYEAMRKRFYAGTGKLRGASADERAAAFAQMREDGTLRGYDPKKHGLSRPPKNWFYAMLKGIKKGSDVRNPAAIVSSIWKRLSPSKKAEIKKREAKGETFRYDLPLPEDMPTRGTGTVRMVKPFKLTEVQVNLSVKDYLTALKSRLFTSMKRQDGTTALVARCKSPQKNVNVFIDKVKP